MIVLLPVSRYRVRYQVASGRPYSFFERFILEGVRDGLSSLDALEQTFRLHRRVLIEGLVTLVQAGWVAIDRKTHSLLPTKAGLRAIKNPEELPRSIVVLEQMDFLIGERVQGQVAKGAEVTFSPRSELRAHLQQVAVMPTSDLPHPLDPGILVPLLRTSELEWIRSCGPIDIVRDGADFAVVDVDTSLETITGIPARWIPLLRDNLLDQARAKERQLVEAGTIYSTDKALTQLVRRDAALLDAAELVDPDEWLLEPGLDRVIVGTEHRALLENWLETARSYICIVAGVLDAATVSELDGPLRAAVERGVVVDVLWGDNSGNRGKEAFELLKKIEWDSHHVSRRGRLTVGRESTDSNARILFGDVSESFETVVGSCDWLSFNSGPDVSLLFRECGPVARIALLIADLAAADQKLSTGVGLTCLRHAAEDLARQGANAAEQQVAEREKGHPSDQAPAVSGLEEPRRGRMRARIVVGRQNHAILPVLADGAHERLVVAGHTWGRYTGNTLEVLKGALKRGCKRVEVRYSEDRDPNGDHAELAEGFGKLGGLVKRTQPFHARIAVADDDTVAVTSFDWLCPNMDRRRAIVSDIGFVLRGDGMGLTLLDRIGIPRVEAPAPLDAEYVTAFRIERLRSVNRVDWQLGHHLAPGWHVLVGDNGAGKTSILRALALALIGSDNAQKLRQDWSTWLRGHETTAEVEVYIKTILGTPTLGSRSTESSVTLTWERTKDGTTFQAFPPGQSSVMSVGYGPYRRFTGGDPEYERQLAVVPGMARHVSLFDERVALTESLLWLRDLRFKALENHPESMLLLDRVTKLVNESGLLPCGIRLSQVTSDTVVFRDSHDYEYGIEELSDGYRSVLSLTFDIVRQLAIRFGAGRVFDQERNYIVTAPAIVLIDEVDAHLHPAWQRTVGQWFRHHFPRIQFIVTTHSPLICQAAQSGSVYRLPNPMDESDSGGMIDGPALARLVYGNVLEAYASGAFGEDVTRSDTSQAFLHRLAELNRKELISGLATDEQEEQEKLRATLPLAAHVTADENTKS